MSDQDVVATALRRKASLIEELKELESFLRMYERLSGSSIPTDEIDESIDQNVGIPQREFVKIAAAALMHAGQPLNSKQILSILKERGIPVGGADELRNLTTKLWRARDHIERLDDGTYWMLGHPRPNQSRRAG